ncbi:MAG TPA: NACHT domain-containing NTPase [Chroococcales cyanobacterium]|jgi:predicted NACHT family NTPase
MGIRVAPEYISQVKQAQQYRFPSQKALADEIPLALSTVHSFLNGRPVHYLNFREICHKLGLDWEVIVDRTYGMANAPEPEIDALVQQVRRYCRDKIAQLYSQMKLLDISQPIDVDSLYVDVNILEQIAKERWLDISDLLRSCKPAAEDFDRLGLGKVREERVPGLEAVKRHEQLMVLGKPGSGKTTFLQYLATQCSKGNLQPDRVPILIGLKAFAKYGRKENSFKLLDYIRREFYSCGISEKNTAERLLKYGKGLILLDGLDEVPDGDEYEVVEEIRQFSQKYYENQLIVTCRIAASKYRFAGFTDVEVADFDEAQIASFADKWFVAIAKSDREKGLVQAKQFVEQLNLPQNQQIRELAVTPLWLHMTCLVFNVKGEFPSDRAKLYQQGLEIMLVRWDESRGIKRDEVYRNLSVPRKKQLLSQLAAIAFEQGDYFFTQDNIQQWIADYLCTLPDAKTNPEQLQLDSEAVLKAIETQHGLLVERARGIYSFSHLTFQEYFTARKIVTTFKEQKSLDPLDSLVSHITEKRWREVFLLAIGMLPSADNLLHLMKQKIDGLVATDRKLQQFLMWVNQKSLSIETSHNPVAFRALYFALDRALDDALDLTLDPRLDLALDPILDLVLDDALKRELDPILSLALNRALIRSLFRALDPELVRAFVRALDPELRQALETLKRQLPNCEGDEDILGQYWQANPQACTRRLREIMISQRHIGYDWQFSKQQREVLRQYYDANKLLVDCLNSGCNVTPSVRQQIEDTLLLPMTQIEKHLVQEGRR